jgi:hypothetical protein
MGQFQVVTGFANNLLTSNFDAKRCVWKYQGKFSGQGPKVLIRIS